MSKDLETGHYVGTVKKDCSEDAKAFAGIGLLIFCYKGDEKAVILGGLTLEDTEKFFKASYENGGKEYMSDDYEECIWLLANEDCELVPYIKVSDLENIRVAIQEDADKFDKSFDEFKKVHKFAEREQAMIKQEEKEMAAVEEFKKLNKVDFTVRTTTRTGLEKIKAVMYKGFAVHNPVLVLNPTEAVNKEITVAEGEYSGIKLLSCNVLDYKKCIDDIRALIGDKELETSDLDLIKPIINKY
ncbi:hypothetical protein [Clostridium butyricum]|uniref:hypothetical protein n=1 Tax=Clostridium butyricum TaxID=1492 RepID=UPI002AAFCDE6|nr:hypothetical protein [Clostridium butyricum]